jgi:hypothetical protein
LICVKKTKKREQPEAATFPRILRDEYRVDSRRDIPDYELREKIPERKSHPERTACAE